MTSLEPPIYLVVTAELFAYCRKRFGGSFEMRSWVFLVLVQGVFGPPPVKRPEGAGETFL